MGLLNQQDDDLRDHKQRDSCGIIQKIDSIDTTVHDCSRDRGNGRPVFMTSRTEQHESQRQRAEKTRITFDILL